MVLSDQDANVLDTRVVNFKTFENCIYCSDGQCGCDVSYNRDYNIVMAALSKHQSGVCFKSAVLC